MKKKNEWIKVNILKDLDEELKRNSYLFADVGCASKSAFINREMGKALEKLIKKNKEKEKINSLVTLKDLKKDDTIKIQVKLTKKQSDYLAIQKIKRNLYTKAETITQIIDEVIKSE